MKIVLCVKITPAWVVTGKHGNAGQSDYMLNPFDIYAIKEAVKLKIKYGWQVHCLCMGPQAANGVLKQCYAMGADDVILLSDMVFAGADTFATSRILANAIERQEYDLIICGSAAIDGETGQVPWSLAKRLGLSCISSVSSVQSIDDHLSVERRWGNSTQLLQVKVPVLLTYSDFTLSLDISLLQKRNSQKRNITIWTSADLNMEAASCGQDGSKTKVVKVRTVESQSHKKVQFLNGSDDEKASFVLEKINHLI